MRKGGEEAKLLCNICGDRIYKAHKYWWVKDRTISGKKVTVHRECYSLDNARRCGIAIDKPDIKAESRLRFKTLLAYKKLTESKQSSERTRRLALSHRRTVRVIKKLPATAQE